MSEYSDYHTACFRRGEASNTHGPHMCDLAPHRRTCLVALHTRGAVKGCLYVALQLGGTDAIQK